VVFFYFYGFAGRNLLKYLIFYGEEETALFTYNIFNYNLGFRRIFAAWRFFKPRAGKSSAVGKGLPVL